MGFSTQNQRISEGFLWKKKLCQKSQPRGAFSKVTFKDKTLMQVWSL
jgi:hypothetical protein